MKKHFIVPLMSLLILSACTNPQNNNASESVTSTQSSTDEGTYKGEIPYAVAENYFLKNTVSENSLPPEKIESKETFDRIFGAATTMGENGMPTSIDFDTQYVIAIAGITTDTLTEITPISLQNNAQNEVIFTYAISKGEKQSFSIKPSLLIIVSKKYDGKLLLKEQD